MICKGSNSSLNNFTVHLFHKNCSSSSCPHCGSSSDIQEICLKLKGKYPPVFIPEMDANAAELFK